MNRQERDEIREKHRCDEKANDFTDDELEYLVNMTFPWIDTDTGKYLDRPIWDKAHAILEARKENQ